MAALDVDMLTAVLTLQPASLARNRHFWLHEADAARTARRRAARIRSLSRHLLGGFGHAHLLGVEPVDAGGAERGGVVLRYRLSRLSLDRAARLCACDLVLLRLLLERGGARLLPTALRAAREDRARTHSWLAAASSLEPEGASGVGGHL